MLHDIGKIGVPGCPAGTKGTAIPLLGRILCVADAYSAMTSDRPYRKALTREEALTELEKSACTHFDPELVRAFQAGFSENGAEYKPDGDRDLVGADAAGASMAEGSA
ncbi:MAG TPA: HD domain-containing phosphohydrolase [Thermoleophilia bacterium]|nr:HD domain-containing phosphohydrolase [Thermoleophilia bacterium]